MKRIALAALLGGMVVFGWGAVAHMVLDIGEHTIHVPPDEAQHAVLDTLAAELTAEGVHLLPILQKDQWEDEATRAEFYRRAAQRPYAFIVFQAQGSDAMADFPRLMATQVATDIVAALLAAILISMMATGYFARVAAVGLLGVFAWLAVSVPYWNWYRFPLDFTIANLLEQVGGWLLAGLVIAWLVPSRVRHR